VTTANSSGNKVRLGGITKAGNRYLRQMLVVGAMAVIRHATAPAGRGSCSTATKLAAIALANKTARIVWALMTSGESYRDPGVPSLSAAE
jgi:transposase